MEIATETERKYDVPTEFRLPDLTGKAGISNSDGGETHDLDATYFDTDDLALMRNRRTLRRRSGGSDAGWHLKTPGQGTDRTEHRLPLNGAPETVPAELVGQVRAIIRRQELKPIARLRTQRVETPLRDAKGNTLALVAQDQVIAERDGHEQRWQEVEVELVDGGPKLLAAVEKALLAAGAAPAAGPSKVARAFGNPTLPKAGPPSKNPVLRYVREQHDAITEYDPGVRRGDPEAVHKMRVGTRRLRSTLKTFKRTFAEAADLNEELKWLADLLGQVRDGQVQEGKLLAGLDEAGPQFEPVAARIREHLDAQVAAGRAALDEALESERYLTLLDRIDQLARQRTVEPDPLRRAHKSLAKADALLDVALAHGEDHELHDARKAYKRARYAVEVFAAEAGDPGKQLVKVLTELQDVLGAHQDSVVARELLHEIGPDSFWFGVLWARQEQVGKDTYKELPVVVESSRRKKLRRWLG
ncbi:CHAD domain-containing protein [Paractinoplanes abujensis]|uniref:CHAD domain-containing protein n=1 Tax=Paractinoplanes abujensis TaxID=882441 RepID=A0A7W7CV03_9ACTN|nr:CYTH and CHAD domain-containing protein [Actinoplanes abujensis]MBB4695174.1 CHAD domain-containing protein [Actinoplanes abujensis]GID23908.1 CHAD domain-containing protein [Actinoplanes abujensis]